MIKYFKPKIIYLILTLTFINGQSYASFAGSFLRMGSSARSMAMGSAFTAEIDPGFAAYHNPASMVFLESRQLGFSHHLLPLDRRFTATNFSIPLPPTASLGVAWISAGVDKIDGRTGAGQHTQYLSTSEDAFMVSFAQQLFPWFSAGINVKILRHQLPINEVDLSGTTLSPLEIVGPDLIEYRAYLLALLGRRGPLMVLLPDLREPFVHRLGPHVLEVGLRCGIVSEDTELLGLAGGRVTHPESMRPHLFAGLSVSPRGGHRVVRSPRRSPKFAYHLV